MAIEFYPSRPSSRPHTRVSVDTSALGGSSSGSEKLVMLVGSAKGGRPGVVYRVRNFVQAQEIFRGGKLLDAMELAWSPSGAGIGAGDILAMRVEDATPATLEQGALKFTSRLYGSEANNIEVEFEEDAFGAGRLIVSLDRERNVYDGLGRIITINYDGEQAYASVEVKATEGKATALILKAGATESDASVVKEFSLGEGAYAEAVVLANEINSIDGFSASISSVGDKNINTSGLEELAETQIKGAVHLKGLLADILKQLEYDNLVTVEVVNPTGTLTPFGVTKLTGGKDGMVPESWAEHFREFANEGGYYLVPLTDKPAIHAEATAFVRERTQNGDPMRVIAGAGYNEAPDKLLNRATALRDARASIVGISGERTMDDGRNLRIDGVLASALVAGLASGLGIGESVTFKNIQLNKLATVYDSAQMDALNAGGVIMAEFVRNRLNTNFRIVEDITTYNDPTDPVRNQIAEGEANDFLVSELRVNLDDNFIGNRIVDNSAALIKNHVQSFLDQKKRDKEIQDYVPEEVQVVINGKEVHISMTIYPINSIRRINASLVYRQQTLTA